MPQRIHKQAPPRRRKKTDPVDQDTTSRTEVTADVAGDWLDEIDQVLEDADEVLRTYIQKPGE